VGRRFHDESGFSLVELVIAMFVLGVGAVAVIGAMGTSQLTSDVHRSLAGGEVAIRDFSESVVRTVRDSGPADTPCPTAAQIEAATAFTAPGYTTEVTEVEYWVADNQENPMQGAFRPSPADCQAMVTQRCAGVPDPKPLVCDSGTVRVGLSVKANKSGAAETTQTAQVVARRSGP
jgi:prepilin-type N-terminal cleavage/methylation domain-containing protein